MGALFFLRALTPISAGALSALGMLFPPIWYASLFGVALFFYTLAPEKKKNIRAAFWGGCFFGLAHTGVALIWFWDVLPVDWLGASTIASWMFVFFSWSIVVASLGPLFGVFSALFVALRSHSYTDVLLAASLWVLVEYAQMWSFALLTWNTESLLGAHFSGVFLGYALAWSSPLLQLAPLGGIYLLTFVAAGMGFFLYTLGVAAHERGKFLPFLVGIIGTLFILTSLDHTQPLVPERIDARKTISVALLSTNSSPDIPRSEEEYAARRAVYAETFEAWVKEHGAPDIAVFPEGGRDREIGSSSIERFEYKAFEDADVFVIDSGIVESGGSLSERMFFWKPEEGIVETYDKQFLVPQGEYTPYLAELALKLPGGRNLAERIDRAERSYARGDSLPVVETGKASVGALFCSDILSPRLYRKLAENGASLFVNASSLAIFHGSPIVDSFVLAMAKVRAAENRRFLLIAAHEAPASVISDRGNVLLRSSYATTSVLSTTILPRTTKTPYVFLGEFILLLPIGIIGVLLFTRYVGRRSEG